MPANAPRRGRPPRLPDIDPATLPPVSRVLRPHLTLAVRTATGLGAATLHGLAAGTLDPRVSTLEAVLAAIRSDDRDGGWGWFGRQLAKDTGTAIAHG